MIICMGLHWLHRLTKLVLVRASIIRLNAITKPLQIYLIPFSPSSRHFWRQHTEKSLCWISLSITRSKSAVRERHNRKGGTTSGSAADLRWMFTTTTRTAQELLPSQVDTSTNTLHSDHFKYSKGDKIWPMIEDVRYNLRATTCDNRNLSKAQMNSSKAASFTLSCLVFYSARSVSTGSCVSYYSPTQYI